MFIFQEVSTAKRVSSWTAPIPLVLKNKVWCQSLQFKEQEHWTVENSDCRLLKISHFCDWSSKSRHARRSLIYAVNGRQNTLEQTIGKLHGFFLTPFTGIKCWQKHLYLLFYTFQKRNHDNESMIAKKAIIFVLFRF